MWMKLGWKIKPFSYCLVKTVLKIKFIPIPLKLLMCEN